ncbi:methyltransferase domain-containing protein [Paenibacillus septentrionalis]|uniref:Methyltransferase domain-containing protein n=1 Tax=Paenibacillus septentrionalis TaxID=429342 RepID=A0ABW1V8V8_9BACL
MEKLALLQRIKHLYEKENINISEYLKGLENRNYNTLEDILISYDFQAGTYLQSYKKNPIPKHNQLIEVLRIMNEELVPCNSLLEAGIGDGTSFINILNGLKYKPKQALGFDLSWSRVKVAKDFIQSEVVNAEQTSLFVGNIFEIPLADSSIDLVYTIHAVEPNGGKEIEAISELLRVTKKYLVMVEPYYEGAPPEAQKQMDRKGYIKGIEKTVEDLGYTFKLNTPLVNDLNPMNPCHVFVIEKNENDTANYEETQLRCPVTKTELMNSDGCYFSKGSLLAYPIIADIPCLTSSNAIIASKMNTN